MDTAFLVLIKNSQGILYNIELNIQIKINSIVKEIAVACAAPIAPLCLIKK